MIATRIDDFYIDRLITVTIGRFESNGCRFILQNFNNKAFAENLMLSVRVDNIDEFQASVLEKKLAEKFPVKIGRIINQPYGRELNIIDLAGVCWHFVG